MPDTSTLAALPAVVSMTALIVPTAVGALLDCPIVTLMACVAVKLPSRAVTVTVADPVATAVIVTVLLDTLTVALVISDDTAV